jgi:hypothetical protein
MFACQNPIVVDASAKQYHAELLAEARQERLVDIAGGGGSPHSGFPRRWAAMVACIAVKLAARRPGAGTASHAVPGFAGASQEQIVHTRSSTQASASSIA